MGGMCDPTELTVVLLLCSHAGRYIRRQISSSMVSLDTPRTCYAVNRAERNRNIQVVLFLAGMLDQKTFLREGVSWLACGTHKGKRYTDH